jgi:hypothetical protein
MKKSLKIPKGQSETIYRRRTQWPKEKVQKDKQRSTKHTYKTKDRVTRTPLKTGGELRCPGRVSSSCSTSGTRNLQIQYSYLHSNVIMCIDVYFHIIDKMALVVSAKIISWYFNRGIDTVKITALSNHKPGILNNYRYIRIIQLF